MSAIINFKRDLREGISKFWSKGQCIREAFYREGFLEGVTKDFASDGTIIQQSTYLRGVLEGSMFRYWLNGNIREETEFSNGRTIGETRYYDEQGKKLSKKREESTVMSVANIFRGD